MGAYVYEDNELRSGPGIGGVRPQQPLLPEAEDAIRIADKHLAGQSVKRRKALALDIQQTIIRHAGQIAADAIALAQKRLR